MHHICYICLRSDRKVRSTSEALELLYEELCEFDNENGCRFCSECIYKLKKFNDFKKSCKIAANKFKLWKKKSINKPINRLYTEMPSQLSISNKNNFKIYWYQEESTAAPFEISSSKHPHVVTLNIPNSDNIDCVTKSESLDLEGENIKQETEFADTGLKETAFINFDNSEDNFKNVQVKLELNKESDSSDDDDKDVSEVKYININDKDLFDSDDSDKELSSLKELLSKIKREKTPEFIDDEESGDEGKVKTARKRKPVDRDGIKSLLRKKFEKFGPVRNDEGTVIDVDVVINHLNTFTTKSLITIQKFCLRKGPFQSNDIRILSRMQARSSYTSLFKITCLQDKKAAMKAQFEKRREYKEYVEGQHRCESCLKVFKCAKILDYHNKIQHDKSMPVECKLCHSRYKNKMMLYKHTQSSHGMLYECRQCDFITNFKSCMFKHYEKHKGKVKHVCKHCGEEFSFNAQLYIHINKMHGAQYICELCACAFHNANGLKQHKIRKHERNGEEFVQSENNTKCEECNVTFISDTVYHKHLTITHNAYKQDVDVDNKERKTRRYPCQVCGWEGSNLQSRKDHYAAEHPNEVFNPGNQGNLKTHLCESCGKGFTNVTLYRDHLNTHTGVRPYACTVCDKSFYSIQCLRMHKERHLPPSRECKICGKKYNCLSNLLRHKRIHTNLKHYVCDICGKVFLQDYLLKAHIKGVHYDGYKKRRAE